MRQNGTKLVDEVPFDRFRSLSTDQAMHSFWHSYYLLIFLIVPNGCQQPVEEKTKSLQQSLSGLTFESGKPEYLSTPFVAAGDRVYLVGHQDGSFPPLGWHVKGEMGGIWDHPIKLLAGFDASLSLNEDVKGFCLDQADAFTNYPMGNTHHFSWHEENIEVERFQFVPDGAEGVVVEFLIRNKGNRQRKFIFSFNSHFNLRPTWLGERTGMKDDEDEVLFLANEKVLLARDKSNPWFAVVGSSREPATYSFENVVCSKVTPVQGKGATLTYQLTVDPGKETVIPFYIAGSYHSRSEALATYFSINQTAGANLVHKIARYDSIKKTAIVEVPDTTLQRMLEWTRYSTDWLIREVPEIGRGLSAGTPDYPWWFGCDSEYALQGVLATGQHGLVKSSILLLKKISNKTNGNGRIIHEASTNGAVYNRGNTNETAQFISLLWQYYEWTGDRDLIIQLYPDVKKGMHWLLTDMDPDQNLFPNGAGGF